MLDIWNGLFGLVAAVVGGVVTGLFMRSQQKTEFRQRAYQAIRALLVELENNLVPVLDLMNPAAREIEPPYPPSFSHFVWETQLPLLTDLGFDTLEMVAEAYRRIDLVLAECARRDRANWFSPGRNKPLVEAHDAARQAMAAIRRAAGLPKQPGPL
jgi:hypothetical protein